MLGTEVAAGRFRSDLFYRINVVALHIPPLRERPEDVMALALHFLEHFNQKFGKDVGPFLPQAVAALESASWPGNVRELQHAIERAVATKSAGPVTIDDLGGLGAAMIDVVLPVACQTPGDDQYRQDDDEGQRDDVDQDICA